MKNTPFFKAAAAVACLVVSASSYSAGWVKTTVHAMHTLSNGDVAFKIGPLRESADIACERKTDFLLKNDSKSLEKNVAMLMAAKLADVEVQILDSGVCTGTPGWDVGIVEQVMLGDW